MIFSARNEGRCIAPAWHTLCVLAALAIVSGLLVYLGMGSDHARIGHIPGYAIMIAFEWAMFALSLWHADAAVASSVARVFQDSHSLLWDIAGALVLAAALVLISSVLVLILGRTGWVSLQGMLPRNGTEIALWIVMAMSAGFCEETVFRGYMQQQFSAWSGNAMIGIVGQAVVFGLCHAYQGWKKMALIFVWGCAFGAYAWLRKGIRANMIAHALLDIIPVV
jgi:membrane protease YdiL (CAAX protease family)